MKKFHQQQKPPSLAVLLKESDRGCVILTSAMLDSKLKLIHEAFVTSNLTDQNPPKDILDTLWGSNGPLGTFSGKIHIAYAYGIISGNEWNALNIIRQLRNEAAHCHYQFSFEDKGVINLITGLRDYMLVLSDLDIFESLPYENETSVAKRQFIAAGFDLFYLLTGKYLKGIEAVMEKRKLLSSTPGSSK